MTFEKFFGHDYYWDYDYPVSVKMFNIHHLIYVIGLLLTYTVVIKFARVIKESTREQKIKTIFIIWLLTLEVIYHIHNWSAGRFSVPLHVCSFAVILNIILLFTDNERVWKYAFFYGILGGSMALLFPVSFGYTYFNIRYYHFLFIHMTIVAIPLYYYMTYNYRVTYKTTLKIFRSSFIIMILMIFVNNLLTEWGIKDANYWFMATIPNNVSNVFNSWTFYVLTFTFAVFLTMNILYFATNAKYIIKNKKLY